MMKLADLSIGDTVVEREVLFTRDSLVRYAGASGDFNPIHYRDDIAQSVGLDGVLAHGMLTMGAAACPVLEALGAGATVLEYETRFTRPVPVDGTECALVTITATVGAIDEATVRIDLNVKFSDQTVLGKTRLTVALSE